MSAVLDIVQVGRESAEMLAAMHSASFCRPGDETWTRKSFSDVLGMRGSFCLVAQAHGRDGLSPCGFSVCRVMGRDSELLSIGVIPAYQRAGTARQLIEASKEQCRQMGARVLFLEVAEDNPVAQQVYTALGFSQVGRRSGYYQRLENRRVDALTMRLDLA